MATPVCDCGQGVCVVKITRRSQGILRLPSVNRKDNPLIYIYICNLAYIPHA